MTKHAAPGPADPPAPHGLEALLDRFNDHLAVERRASRETVRAYLADVAELCAFAAKKLRRPVAPLDLDMPTAITAETVGIFRAVIFTSVERQAYNLVTLSLSTLTMSSDVASGERMQGSGAACRL